MGSREGIGGVEGVYLSFPPSPSSVFFLPPFLSLCAMGYEREKNLFGSDRWCRKGKKGWIGWWEYLRPTPLKHIFYSREEGKEKEMGWAVEKRKCNEDHHTLIFPFCFHSFL